MTNANLLTRLLDKLFHPVRLQPPDPLRVPVDVVVLCVDSEYEEPFWRAHQTMTTGYHNFAQKTVPVVFKPELEVLLTQTKEPLERALGLMPCSSGAPEHLSDPKRALSNWLSRYARRTTLDTEFRERVADKLDLGPQSPLRGVACYQQLAEPLLRLTRRKTK